MEGRSRLIFRGSVRDFNLHCVGGGDGGGGRKAGEKGPYISIFGGTEKRGREWVDVFGLDGVLDLVGKEDRAEDQWEIRGG